MAKSRYFNIALTIIFGAIICLPHPTIANDFPQPVHFKGIYSFEFAGLPIGQMGIEVAQEPRHYAITSDVATTGLLKLFVKHSSHTTVDGSGTQDFTYPEAEYESHYQTRGKKKYVKMLTHAGITGGEILIPPDPPTRKPVPPDMKKNIADPLTTLLRMREEVWKAIHNHTTHFSINLYDGRRLTQVNFIVGDKQNLRINGGKIPVIAINVTRKLLAGFTESELAIYDPHESGARFYVTDDERLIPIRAEATLLFGTISATLAKECTGAENCLLGIKE